MYEVSSKSYKMGKRKYFSKDKLLNSRSKKDRQREQGRISNRKGTSAEKQAMGERAIWGGWETKKNGKGLPDISGKRPDLFTGLNEIDSWEIKSTKKAKVRKKQKNFKIKRVIPTTY